MVEFLNLGFQILKISSKPKKSFFDSKKISLNQTNLCIAIQSRKTFFHLRKFLDYFFFFKLKKSMSVQSHGTCAM